MKFIGKIKESIKQKNNEKLSQRDAMLENETIRSKYTRDELEAAVKGAREVADWSAHQLKRRRREDRRRRAVEWAGGIFTFVGINGSFFILLHQFGIFTLLADKCGLGPTLSAWIIVVLWIGFAFLLALTFFWLSDKTGLHYLIEDWVVSFHKYKEFPRKKRSSLIRDVKKELDEITDQLYRLECESDETEDEKLSDSVDSLNQVVGVLVTEADISSRSLIHQPEHASWKGFVLALEETSNDLELELKDIAKYHSKIQPMLKHASNITSKALYWVIDYYYEKKKVR
ncbi:MAG: hypothetical protein KKD24_00970 [Proteobacteria bacterium]|nr:hypothetical protein [Pseudomonadota bacterium]